MTSAVTGTVARTMLVLRYLADTKQEVTIRDAARTLQLPPSTVHRLLDLLRSEGFVEHDAKLRRYRVGPELQRIATSICATSGFPATARAALGRITRRTGETAVLAQYDPQTSSTCATASTDGVHTMRTNVDLFRPIPVTDSAAGWAVLAGLDDRRVQYALERNLRGSAKAVATEAAALRRELQLTRARGYALRRTREEQAVEIAVPLRGRGEDMLGSVSVLVPHVRCSERAMRQIADVLHMETAALSRSAGYAVAREQMRQ